MREACSPETRLPTAPLGPTSEPGARRRILVLAPFPPRLDATHGGGRAMAQLLVRLAERHRVALLHLRAPDEPPLDSALAGRLESAEAVARIASGRRLPARLLRRGRIAAARLGGRPRWVSHVVVPAFAERLRARVRSWRPEIVQLEFHVMGAYLRALGADPAPRVLVAYEAGTRAARDLVRAARGPLRLLRLLDLWAWERFERDVLRRVDAAVAFTGPDRRALAALAGSTPVHEIPLGAELPDRALDPRGRPPYPVVFVGNGLHPPNADAALRLVESILPRLRARWPEAAVEIVGEAPPVRLVRSTFAGVTVTGRVPDVAAHLDRAAVVAAPLRLGGGMRVKVLEALAAGKAVVASPLAIEGLAVRDGEELLVAPDDDAFAAALARLLADPGERTALAGRARAWALANLGWERSVAAYEALYADLLAQPVRRAR
jgi:glycosyltransferase involved in cell wall biosynthesis